MKIKCNDDDKLIITVRDRLEFRSGTSLVSMSYSFVHLINKYGRAAKFIPLDGGCYEVEYTRYETDKEYIKRKKNERRMIENQAKVERSLWKKHTRSYGNK